MPLKAQLFLGLRRTGFSEIYYFAGSDLNIAAGQMAVIEPQRLAMLTADVTSLGYRISDLNTPRNTLTVLNDPVKPGTHVAPQTQTSQQDSDALRLAQRGANNSQAIRFLHAPPEDYCFGQSFTPSAGWTGAFNTWKAQLITACSLRHKTATGFIFPAIISFGNPVLTTRRVGRPFGLPRGRRLAV